MDDANYSRLLPVPTMKPSKPWFRKSPCLQEANMRKQRINQSRQQEINQVRIPVADFGACAAAVAALETGFLDLAKAHCAFAALFVSFA